MNEGEQPVTSDFERAAEQLDNVPPPILELLDRQATAFLYAVWRARGIHKRIIVVKVEEEQDERQSV